MADKNTATVIISARHKLFAIPEDPTLQAIVQSTASANVAGKRVSAFPHTHETTRLARNLGYRVPAPIMSQYDWAGSTPFRTQRLTAAMLTMNRRAYVLSEMGTGKTRAALYAADFLLQQGDIKKILVVAPLSTLTPVWDREVILNFPHLTVGTLYGSRDRRLKVLKQPHDIYLINHEGIITILPELLAATDIDLVVIDELAVFRNAGTERWKVLNKLLQGRKYVWGLTGSPTPNEPVDAWAQCRLITPHSVSSAVRYFRDATMRKVSTFTWVPRPEANEYVMKAMQPAARFTRDECVELPETVYATRDTPMSAQQEDTYKKLMSFAYAQWSAGEITAINEGVLFNKLMQVSSGWVYDTKHQTVDLSPQPRLDALMEIIDEASQKVIVFATYTHTVGEIYEALNARRAYRGKIALVTGEVSKTQRDKIFADFQNQKNPQILIAHPKCMSHGLTLTAANVIVWYSLPALDTYEQACARITRPGQKHKQLIMHLIGSKVETKAYKRIQTKAKMQGALLELFESEEAL